MDMSDEGHESLEDDPAMNPGSDVPWVVAVEVGISFIL